MAPATRYSFLKQLKYLQKEHAVILYLWVFLFLLLIFFTFLRVRNSDNTRSRIITVERLVERGSFAHVAPGDTTPFPLSIDAVMVGDRMYSSKPPVYPLIMAGEAWLIKKMTGWGFYAHRKDYIRFLTVINQVIPYMIVVLVALAMASWYYPDRRTLLFLLLMMTVASLPYGYSVTINNHLPAAVSFFIFFYLVWLIRYQGREDYGSYILAGIFAGLGAVSDLPGLALALAGLYILFKKDSVKSILSLLILLSFLAISAFVFWKITGSIKPIYLQGDLYHYSGSYWDQRMAFDRLKESRWRYLFHITFGHHGLFSVTPVLLLSLWSLIRLSIRKDWEIWSMLKLFSLAILSIFLFVLFRTNNYGGYAIGMRWFLLFMPILTFAASPLVAHLSRRKAGILIISVLILSSIPAVAEALYYEAFYRSWLDRLWLGNL